MFNRSSENRPYTTSTTPKMKLFAQTTDSAEVNRPYNKFALTGELLPLYMVLGMMIGAAGIGTHTAFKQLEHCPNVSASKKKRTSILEVEDPDFIISSAHRYTNKSVLRRVYRVGYLSM
ncbi:hypothetical protein Pint_05578 [Pistacia integerrima]|uniref:Uncharacterized protein n=1 Tax=Pistacia integerrima TaxID=434235 RepID=A0ACC0Z7F7_9ROSI|nr:hypothetical protein Pint_05578 [Pistacia integerrima]